MDLAWTGYFGSELIGRRTKAEAAKSEAEQLRAEKQMEKEVEMELGKKGR
jgi:hypothetical protein